MTLQCLQLMVISQFAQRTKCQLHCSQFKMGKWSRPYVKVWFRCIIISHLLTTSGTISIINSFIQITRFKCNISVSNWVAGPDKSKCFRNCGRKSGKCSYCSSSGVEGYCCRRDYANNRDCPDPAIAVAPYRRHGCVHQSNLNWGKISNKIIQSIKVSVCSSRFQLLRYERDWKYIIHNLKLYEHVEDAIIKTIS